MSWAIGYDENWKRDIGYGVPSICDHPGCNNAIHRGLAYVCGGEPYGGEHGCGLYFCPEHLEAHVFEGEAFQCCSQCSKGASPFSAKADTAEWREWKLTDESWQRWRDENPAEVAALKEEEGRG